jgi:hypothetical protein
LIKKLAYLTLPLCEVFGILHKPGRKTVSVEKMDAKIRQRMKDNFL